MPIKFNSIIPQGDCTIQPTAEILVDRSSTGKVRPWKKRKTQSQLLAESYSRLEMEKRSVRVNECGSLLEFARCPEGHETRLVRAYFCRDRLCPMCQWRRSLIVAHQVRLVTHTAVVRNPDLRFIFLTLTTKNVSGESLKDEISKFTEGWKRFINHRRFKGSVEGWIRALEVTHNLKRDSYHPHFHVLIAVPSRYFKDKRYISQKEWGQLWKSAMRLDYNPVVDVRIVRARKPSDDMGAVSAELIKYASKPEDYIVPDNEAVTDDAVMILFESLKGRRLLGWGGVLKDIWRELKSLGKVKDAEAEDVDMVHIEEVPKGCQCSVCNSDMLPQLFEWCLGIKNYRRINK